MFKAPPNAIPRCVPAGIGTMNPTGPCCIPPTGGPRAGQGKHSSVIPPKFGCVLTLGFAPYNLDLPNRKIPGAGNNPDTVVA